MPPPGLPIPFANPFRLSSFPMALSHRHRRFRTLAATAAVSVLAAVAEAQTSTIIDRAQQANPAVPPPPTDRPPAAAPGSGSDEGSQRIAEPRRCPVKVSVAFDEQLTASNNVYLTHDGNSQAGEEAIVSATTVSLRVETLPVVVGEGQLLGSVGFVYQAYVHGIGRNDTDLSDLDFDSFSLPLSVSYRWGKGWETYADLTLGQLYSVRGSPAFEKLFASATGSLGVRKLTELRRDLLLATGVGLAHSETWTSLRDVPSVLGYRDDRDDKLTASADISLYVLRGDWILIPYVRISQTHYYHYEEAQHRAVDRDDTTVSGGLSLTWNFNSWGSVRVFSGYDQRFSNQDGPASGPTPKPDYTYSAGSVGLGASVNLRY